MVNVMAIRSKLAPRTSWTMARGSHARLVHIPSGRDRNVVGVAPLFQWVPDRVCIPVSRVRPWTVGIGLRRHAAVVRKELRVEQFPDAYFAMLAVQLLPLTITGFVRQDAFVIGTRIATLATVLIVYGVSSSKTGTFDTIWYRLWILFWLSVVVIGPMVYVGSRTLQQFIADYEKWIAYASVAAMVLFVIYGQRVAASTLFNHFVSGNYSIKRFSLQIVRFFGFSLQAIHYGLVFGWRNAIFFCRG